MLKDLTVPLQGGAGIQERAELWTLQKPRPRHTQL